MGVNKHPDSRPKAWLVAYAFGVASEVWMHRQASMFRRLNLSVMTNRYQNADRFPAETFDVRLVRGRWRLPPWQPWRDLMLDSLGRFNRKVPGFAKSPAETAWWLQQIDESKPDVVLAHFGDTAMEFFPLLESAGIPVVSHFNGFDLSRALRNKRYCRRLREFGSRFAAHVVVADYMRDALQAHGVPDNKIIKIPYGTPATSVVRSERNNQHGCRFLAVGRLVDKKRPDLTLRAFAVVAARDSNSRLVMIGDGARLESCKQLAASLEIGGRVDFLGSQPQRRVLSEFAKADVFVQHSATAADGDKEGWPVAIAEAAAAELPVVATRHASIPEQVIHGEGGFLCDEGDWQAMAQNMLALAADSDLRAKMGKAAKDRMAAMNVENQVRLLENVLLDAAGRSVSDRHAVLSPEYASTA